MAIRWALLKRHYRKDYLWQRTEIQSAEAELHTLKIKLESENTGPTKELIQGIYSAIADDLNTPLAISMIIEWSSSESIAGQPGDADRLREVIDALLGIDITVY
jgi:L-cysteine:1D-myo-inositol 2-amino-2-deoxy-alpha-D-glucopyranoside ligase